MNGFEVLMTWSKCLRLVCYLQKILHLWTCSYLMLVLNPSNTIMERSKCQDGTKKKLRYSRFNFSRTLWNTEHLKELASRRRFKLCRVHFFSLSTPIGALFLLISSSKTNMALYFSWFHLRRQTEINPKQEKQPPFFEFRSHSNNR